MPHPIEAMEGEEERQRELDRHLGPQRHGGEAGDQARGLENVHAQQRLDEVAKAEDVEGARKDGAREAVEGRCQPCYLRPVDAQVRGDGAVAALPDEDVVALILGDVCCGGESVGEEKRGVFRQSSGFLSLFVSWFLGGEWCWETGRKGLHTVFDGCH